LPEALQRTTALVFLASGSEYFPQENNESRTRFLIFEKGNRSPEDSPEDGGSTLQHLVIPPQNEGKGMPGGRARRLGCRSTPQAAGLGIRGGIMRTGRTIIISAILALGAAGSILTTTAISTATAAHATTAHVEAANSSVYYHE
jgi:hypothetical protein